MLAWSGLLSAQEVVESRYNVVMIIIDDVAAHWTWGVLPDDWDRNDSKKFQQDTEQANRTIEVLRADHSQPFFMICGLYRPHGPWTVAKLTTICFR